MQNIGIIGRARSGKDTAGQWLVENREYRRIGFADPLKEAALKLDPIVCAQSHYSLSMVVRGDGWERAKDEFPEVRRILQELGAAVRAIDEDFWLRAAMKRVLEANEAGIPVVITDVRYPNEVDSLHRAGFALLYLHRPGTPQLDHESERLGPAAADHLICNDRSIRDLHDELALFHDRATRGALLTTGVA
ncbi:hypothetical protein CP967_31170 [Streptomyces nitrosporeus]|uniref:Deoxynucleoside monophosphate kinase n=1 Tax=Streptomyces nitrosporeus TaxID=28894 RepID=A0A5J6FHZ2_9ACTN|nr:hypothetical protein [Streptomyces nitrosporeus]QEU75833.1 hypothetical protein CP967_31170 [Streptomyces nitrosporeus]GGY88642.1 hypothetical protein GCM10010327_19200 [Streptomyces nitrosporeus]